MYGVAGATMKTRAFHSLGQWLRAVTLGLSAASAAFMAVAQSNAPITTGLTVTLPNGYANINAQDMRLMTTAGEVRWVRMWDGQEWKFQPQWESLSQSWKNLTGSQSADTTAGTVSGGGNGSANGGSNVALTSAGGGGGAGGGCWVWVDEDWQPSVGSVLIGGIPEAGPMLPARTTPFNRVMGEDASDYPPVQRVSVDFGSLCAGSSLSGGSSFQDAEGIRRMNELYLGSSGRYAFNNRTSLEKRAVQQLPSGSAASLYAQLGTGRITLNPSTNAKGFRWLDRAGDWIDYNTQGQVVAYGDRNNNMVWMVRDGSGILRGVVDANGRVLFSLHYKGELLAEIRDYPAADISGDLPSRSVKYEYDDKNRLVKVVDVRGNTMQYAYDAGNHITQVTDPEGRVEQLVYSGDTVKQRTAPDGAVTDYVFDYDDVNKQFLAKVTGPETEAGRRVEDFTYNRAGKLVRRIVNGRTEEEVQHDTGSRTKISVNARGFVTRTTRNEFDQVVEVVLPDGTARRASYSPVHLGIDEEVDEVGTKTQYFQDAKGNLLRTVEAVGTADERTTEFSWSSTGQLIQVKQKGRVEKTGAVTEDATWVIDRDDQGQIQQTTDPEGNVLRYQYDRSGNLIRLIDARGNVTRYELDAAGLVTAITDGAARTRRYQRDKLGNVTLATDARGQQVSATYDAVNRRLDLVNAVGGIQKVRYNAQGLPIKEIDEDGRATLAEFDNFLRITKQIDGLGHVTTFSYALPDGSDTGGVGALFDPTEARYPTFTHRQRYDALERPTTQTLLNPNRLRTEGLVSNTTYDKRGMVVSETDANGKTRGFQYNALGQLTQATDSLGNKTFAVYDVRGNLIQITDTNGNVNKFVFDRNNRMVREILPLGQTTQYEYDAAGNLIRKVDANGHQTDYTLDGVNRLTEVKQTKSGGGLVRTTRYTWDEEDHLTAWTDTDHSLNQVSSAALTYDAAGRKTEEAVTYPGGTTLSYRYAYSPAGYVTRVTWADGTAIDYAYSGHGQLQTVSIPGEGTISVSEYKWVEPTKITLPGGSSQERTVDGLLFLEELKVKSPSQQTVLSVSNTWGKVQELKAQSRSDTAGVTTTRSSNFSYDDETRLVEANADSGGVFGTDTERFTLDGVGNRVAHSKVSGSWIYDANNRLTRIGDGSCGQSGVTCYAYDQAGNLTQKQTASRTLQYRYDTQNRLVLVQESTGNLIARYGYDPLDRRIWKEQFRDRDGQALSQALRTYYLYAEEGLLAEATQPITLQQDGSVVAGSAPQVTTQYGFRPGSDWGTEPLFIKTMNSNGQFSFGYFHHNQIHTPLQATDAAGNIIWSAAYNVFGKVDITTPLATEKKATIDVNIRFSGQYEDGETGLYYNFRRYYDPETGRYIQSDPIGLAGGVNTYAYVNGNPLTYVDPYGLFGWADMPALPDWLVDGVAGFGDDISFGLTRVVRRGLDIGSVNYCSAGYKVGTAAGMAWGLAWGGATVGRHSLNVGFKKFFKDSRTYPTVQAIWSRSVGGYKGKYDLHHWFTPQSAGGTSAGWNLVPVTPRFNRAMSNGGRLFSAFKFVMLGAHTGAISTFPVAAILNDNPECECENK